MIPKVSMSSVNIQICYMLSCWVWFKYYKHFSAAESMKSRTCSELQSGLYTIPLLTSNAKPNAASAGHTRASQPTYISNLSSKHRKGRFVGLLRNMEMS